MAEAEAPIKDAELIKIEDVFIRHAAKAILEQLENRSPIDRTMQYIGQKKFPEKGAEHRDAWIKSKQVWSKGRLLKNQHLANAWAISSGSLGKKTIYNRMPYSYYLAKGTGIYGPRGTPITPRTKKAMSFYYGFIKRWVVTRQIRGINPARFQKEVIAPSQFQGTIIGVRRATAELERTWRGTLRTKLIRL